MTHIIILWSSHFSNRQRRCWGMPFVRSGKTTHKRCYPNRWSVNKERWSCIGFQEPPVTKQNLLDDWLSPEISKDPLNLWNAIKATSGLIVADDLKEYSYLITPTSIQLLLEFTRYSSHTDIICSSSWGQMHVVLQRENKSRSSSMEAFFCFFVEIRMSCLLSLLFYERVQVYISCMTYFGWLTIKPKIDDWLSCYKKEIHFVVY